MLTKVNLRGQNQTIEILEDQNKKNWNFVGLKLYLSLLLNKKYLLPLIIKIWTSNFFLIVIHYIIGLTPSIDQTLWLTFRKVLVYKEKLMKW